MLLPLSLSFDIVIYPRIIFIFFSYMVEIMKSTDIKRRDREIKRSRKKEELLQKKVEKRDTLSVGEFINKLYSLFYHDDQKIYNLDSEEIKEVIIEIQTTIPESKWEVILRKAIRKSKIAQREEAVQKLKSYLSE
jgi:hypothetical protein